MDDFPVVAIPLGDQSVAEDGLWSFVVPAGTFVSPDNKPLTLAAVSAGGAPLPVWLSFDAETGAFSGSPPQDFNGSIDVTVIASDGVLLASNTFRLVVTPVNDAPTVANTIPAQSILEDTTWTFAIPTGVFADVDGDALTLSATLADGSPLPAWLTFDAAGRGFEATPPRDFNGFVDVALSASDGRLAATTVFRLTITPVNDAPVPRDDAFSVKTNTPLVIATSALLANDADPDQFDQLVVGSVGDARRGSVSLAANGAVTFTPEAGYAGPAGFTYTVSDGAGGASSAVVEITVTPNVIVGTAGGDILNGTTGADAIDAGAGNDFILAGLGNDTLIGGAGADVMIGGSGDDRYFVDDIGDVVIEAGGGVDTVETSISYTLATGVEKLVLGGADAIDGVGNNLSNTLIGNAANNVLDGAGGADTLIGGAGDDIYVVDSAANQIVERANEGVDTVSASIGFTLGAELENLTLTGSSNRTATGNELDNFITGNSGNNVLDGAAGADTLAGGAGNDAYVVDNAADVVVEAAGEGVDIVRSSVTHGLSANVENLTLTGTGAIDGAGNDQDNILTGNVANNVLDGGLGADTLIGGLGDDVYVVDDSADIVRETSSAGGTDFVYSSASYALAANVENLTLTGTGAIDALGNALANILTGNAASNVLDGRAGADTMIGGRGDDTYVVDNVGDGVAELAGEGDDTIMTFDRLHAHR